MSSVADQKVPMRRGLRILLVASLALNVAVVGLAIGAAFKWRGDGPPRAIEFAAGPLGQALSQDDRRALGEALRRDPSLRFPSRRELEEMMDEVVTIVATEPFDRAALEQAMAGMRGRVTDVQTAASALLVDRIEEMSTEERARYAAALAERQPRERRGN